MNDSGLQNMTDGVKKRQILIVDDDSDVLQIMSTILESLGATVSSTNRPERAVEIALGSLSRGETFDLIIVDIRMPVMNGHEVARRIKEGGYTGSIIAFTANATMTGKHQSEESGIDNYFSKATMSKNLLQALLDQYCEPPSSISIVR